MIATSILLASALAVSLETAAPCRPAQNEHRAALEAAALRSLVDSGPRQAPSSAFPAGCAVVLYRIAADGRLSNVRVAFASSPAIEQAGLDSVRGWRYAHGNEEEGGMIFLFGP